ncbi:hypothetical protein, partial [Sellimonas intestinalis]|uniref:hypothetical protein n=1 Tax=Sellimonas intestinalis TaxID=1653434 RepID=UPI003994B32D
QKRDTKETKKKRKRILSEKYPQNTPKKKPLLRRVLLILGIFAAIIFGMMSCLAPKIKNVTIDDLDWERTIDIEEVVTHNESDWSLPDDARLQYTKVKFNPTKTFSTITRQLQKPKHAVS